MPENSTVESTQSRQSARTFEPRIGLALVALALGSTACGAVGPGEQTDAAAVGQTQEGISGGVLAANNNAPFSSAVKLGVCSGAKVAARMFLTAAHCSVIVNPQRAANGGTQLTVDNSLGGNSPTTVGVDRFYIHPSYTNPTLSPANPSIDAAVLFVSQDTPSIPTLPVDTGIVNDGVGIPVLGYGCDDRNPAHGGQKQWWNLVTLSKADLLVRRPDMGALNSNYMFYDGGPTDGDYHQVCTSDSGGPAVNSFLNPIGVYWKVTGITVDQMIDVTQHRKMSVSVRTGAIAAWLITPTLGAVHGTITNVLSGMCLSGVNAVTSGSPVVLTPCDPTTTASGTQYWQVMNKTFGSVVKQQLQNGKSGLCLDGGTVADATSLTMSTCANVPQQRWALTANPTTPSEIVQELSGQNMGALGAYTDLSTRENTNRQRWLIVPTP